MMKLYELHKRDGGAQIRRDAAQTHCSAQIHLNAHERFIS